MSQIQHLTSHSRSSYFCEISKNPPYLSNTRRHTVHTSVTSTNHDHVLITCICDVNLQISWRKQKIHVPPDSTTKLDFVPTKPCETFGKPYILQQKDMLLTSLGHRYFIPSYQAVSFGCFPKNP